MCGIVGFIGRGDRDDVLRMVQTIRYRGPDDVGVYAEQGVGLGHARLSIIDLSPSGHQPMWNMEHSVSIVFNGEIYNFSLLKKELAAKGHVFQSTSDTEVIIALYKEYGEKCFERLSGMFAIALYDVTKKKLLLARDRMGKKPLYYGVFGGTLLFASEPKAIFAHTLAKKEVDLDALNSYLALDYVPTPQSIFKGVAKLEPGVFLSYEGGNMRKEKYWNPDFRETTLSFPDALRELDVKLSRSVSSRLVADVPLGIFLSGGLDSSTIAYYATRASTKKIDTFSIGFDEASFDESQYAKEVSLFLDSTHHHHVLRPKDSLDIIPKIFSQLDEPLADASIIPTYLLSRFTKEHVTVALGGDGGDELFAGYPTFQAEKFVSAYQMIPSSLRKGFISRMIHALPISHANFSLDFKLKKFIDGAEEDDIILRHVRWLGTFNDHDRAQLLMAEVQNSFHEQNPLASLEKFVGEFDAKNAQNKLLWAYQRSYMMDQVLAKVDRASMFASLETRSPFLDHELVEFANGLPYQYKMHGLATKYILKELMKDKLPHNIVYRQKKGFGIPVASWLRGPLRDWSTELLSKGSINKHGLFQQEYIDRLKDEHFSGEKDNRKQLWNLIVFALWQDSMM